MSIFGQLGNTLGLGTSGASNQVYGAVANGGLGSAQQMTGAQYNQMMNANIAQQRGVQAGTRPTTKFDPNELEAFQIPLSQLVTMWRLKYEDRWVQTDVPHDDSFYAHACSRLAANDLFERAYGWARLKEDV